MKDPTTHTRGLESIRESRARRLQGKLPAIPTRFWLWTFTALAAWGVFYWKKTQGEVESQKAALLARQRGIFVELGAKVNPLLERVETWTRDAARDYSGDRVTAEARSWDFLTAPGIYLRLRKADAGSEQAIRKSTMGSLRDAFTACLFREPNADPTSGPACSASRDCSPGTFCNEADHCMPPAQPYNMRAAYRGTRVLGDEWTDRLRAAADDMSMRLLEREFESAVKDDIPLVIDLMTRAQFLLLVLDEEGEDPKAGTEPHPSLDELQAMPHAIRVFLHRLRGDGDPVILRLRRVVDGRFVPAGPNAPSDPRVVEAQQRQVNGCQLALAVRDAVGR